MGKQFKTHVSWMGYPNTPRHCVRRSGKLRCNANEEGQKVLTTHIWQECLDLVEQLRKTSRGKALHLI